MCQGFAYADWRYARDQSLYGLEESTRTAQTRPCAERSGIANGRVYLVSFSATDGSRGACTGEVAVGVPHDQGPGSVPIDDGQNFDSTLP